MACQAETTNRPPVAEAGADLISYVQKTLGSNGLPSDAFDEVLLDGSGSYDPDGTHVARYFWAFDTIPVGSELDGAAFTTNGDSSPTTAFTPDLDGIYGVTLEVFDGQMVSQKDYVQVEVIRLNGIPVAAAGADINGMVGVTTAFNGLASQDPDGDYLSYHWELMVVPPGSHLTTENLGTPATATPRLTPDVPGVYALSLEVFDGLDSSLPDFVTLTVASGNLPPVVDPGESRTITPCFPSPITLDGSGSYDPEGDPFSWQWSLLEAPYGSQVTDESLLSPQEPITQVGLDLFGLYVFSLTLDDLQSSPSSGTVAILFDNGSTQEPPVADAGGNATGRGQTTCTADGCPPCQLSAFLDGSSSRDANLDPLAWSWQVISGDGILVDPSLPVVELLAPPLSPPSAGRTISATVKVELTVSDCVASSQPSVASVTFTCEGY